MVTLEDAILNGRYCKSGFAYQSGNKAVCFSIKQIKVKSDMSGVTFPYACDPSQRTATFPYDPSLESNRCYYYYAQTTDQYYSAPCDCAMTGGT